jgi:ribosome-binding factor A
MAEIKRSVRVAERLREELALLLSHTSKVVGDPRVRGAIVSTVELTDDLQLAHVAVRLPAEDDPARRKALLRGLESASGVLRREVGKRLGLRYTPRLEFRYDESPEQRSRIDALLDEIAREPRADPDKDDEKT